MAKLKFGEFSHGFKLAVASLVLVAAPALAAPDQIELKVDANAKASAAASTLVFRHARPSNKAGLAPRELEFRGPPSAEAGTVLPAAAVTGPTGNRYPADLTYHGGPVATSLVSYGVFINTCPIATCWGDPLGFLSSLGKSSFIHIIDQYVGASANNRYTVAGLYFTITGSNIPQQLTDADIQVFVTAAARAAHAAGYGAEYHVFLPPGTDLCFDNTYSICYSPDIPATFYFCAYHGSVDVPNVGHILYSAEPYQNVPGCADTGATPNGTLTDSTDNVLSHELFETITDPDGTAWTNTTDNALYGDEIGDECSFVNATGFDPSIFKVGSKVYAAQPEYSNITHACSTSSGD